MQEDDSLTFFSIQTSSINRLYKHRVVHPNDSSRSLDNIKEQMLLILLECRSELVALIDQREELIFDPEEPNFHTKAELIAITCYNNLQELAKQLTGIIPVEENEIVNIGKLPFNNGVLLNYIRTLRNAIGTTIGTIGTIGTTRSGLHEMD